MTRPAASRQRGFTLVEMVAVMVITGILATIAFTFLKLPVRNYVTSVARAAATDLADNSLRRVTRDLRLALPNSIRVDPTGAYIEYLDTRVGLRYIGDDDVNTPLATTPLSWESAASLTFTVPGGLPTGRLAPAINDSIVIYNLGPGQEPANAYDCSGQCNRTAITGFNIANGTLTMASNVFAAQTAAGVALKSPGKRFHVVTGPVSYGCDAATRRLTRYWGYAISAVQALPPTGGSSAILAENVSCSFSYVDMASRRSGLVGMQMVMTIQNVMETGNDQKTNVTLHHQVHVNNTP